jgi:undecaprenyl pyrophosphate synthase
MGLLRRYLQTEITRLQESDRMWPEFDADDLAAAIGEFHRRERRFGAVPSVPEPDQAVPSAA